MIISTYNPSILLLNLILLINNNNIIINSINTEKLQIILISLNLLLIILINIQNQENININQINLIQTYSLMFSLLILVFITSHSLVFFICFESSIIPIFIVILIWGNNPENLQAGFYIILYTLISSLPFLNVLLNQYNENQTLEINLQEVIKNNTNMWWAISLLIFIVKMPSFLLHIWLPNAHVEAPVSGSITLAGIILNLGSYGLINFIPLSLKTNEVWQTNILTLGILGSTIISVICVRQIDLNIIIALSSVAHISSILAAISNLSSLSTTGAYFVIVSHGLCSANLFFIINIGYNNNNTRNTQITNGIISNTPTTILNWFLICILNISAPPSVSFSGEILITSATLNLDSINTTITVIINFIVGIYCVIIYTTNNQGKSNSIINTTPNSIEIMTNQSITVPLILLFVLLNNIA